ncbi:MAG: succinyldiaminopimelate transaminase [Actinobacteria bacterium]|nr:succinyldiaminopimelate transaminase [Actinomycetota bacterium]
MKLPDFPWDALAPYGARAREHAGGLIDLSQGTPVDAVPGFIQKALQDSSNAPSYPLTIGTPELREAMRNWATKILGATGEFDVLPTIGSKELVAWLPTILEAKTVLYPKVAYPTYLVGSMIHGAKAIPVDIDASTWPKSEMAWINSPSNPTGRVHSVEELQSVISYARSQNSLVVSDECYISFPAKGAAPVSILKLANGDNKNLIAVHSMSKRSNLAGYRAGLIVGDAEIIGQIREVRKHAGMMVPLPIQRAMTAALGDETHVAEQAERYSARREILSGALIKAGFQIDFSTAGLYIWCTRNESSWDSVAWLAGLGILATPGIFYGEAGAQHIRIAMTASDTQIKDAADRILKSL